MIRSWPYCWAYAWLPEDPSARRCKRLGIEVTPEQCTACPVRSAKPPEDTRPRTAPEPEPELEYDEDDGLADEFRSWRRQVCPRSGIVGSRYKTPKPSQEELQKRAEKPCKTCRWHVSLNGNNVYIYCSYLTKTGHARPCKPEECISAGVYEKQERKEKPEYGRALDDYGLGEEDLDLVDGLIEKIARDRERQEEDEKI